MGMYFCRPFGVWLLEYTRLDERPAFILAFIATMFLATMVMLLLRFVLKNIIKIVINKKFDKLAGCVAGFIRATVFVIIFFLMMNLWPHDYLNRVFGEESFIGSIVLRWIPEIVERGRETRSAERGTRKNEFFI